MHLAARESDGVRYQGTVTVEMAVDVSPAVLGIPGLLRGEHVVEGGLGAERLLLRPGAAVVSTARVHEGGEVEDGKIGELRATAAELQDGGDAVLVGHGHGWHRGLGRGSLLGDVRFVRSLLSRDLLRALDLRKAVVHLDAGNRGGDFLPKARLHVGDMPRCLAHPLIAPAVSLSLHGQTSL